MNKVVRLVVVAIFLLSSVVAHAQIDNQDILAIGDSLTAGLARSPAGTITCAALGGIVIASNNQRSCRGDGREGIGGWQPRLKQLSNAKVYNYGSSGELTSEMVARINAHLQTRDSKYVLIMGGTNDVIIGLPTATIIANLTNLISSAKAAGRVPVIATVPPLLNSRFRNRNPQIVVLNAAIRNIPNVMIADQYNELVGNWAANTSGDFVHLGLAGNNVVAQTWFDVISSSKAAIIVPILDLLLLE